MRSSCFLHRQCCDELIGGRTGEGEWHTLVDNPYIRITRRPSDYYIVRYKYFAVRLMDLHNGEMKIYCVANG